MKKAILILFIMITIPSIINAKCNDAKHQEAISSAKNITYDIEYNKNNNKFTMTIYNLTDDMYAVFNKKNYKQNNNKVIIDNLLEGTNVTVEIYNEDGCGQSVYITKTSIPYYNTYYYSAKCKDYKNILTMCNSEFTKTKVTSQLLDLAISNYNNRIIMDKEENEEEVIIKEPFYKKIEKFTDKWGLKIALVLSSGMITYIICASKLRKEIHGV